MKCINCGAETPNRWAYGSGGLCHGEPFVSGTPEFEAALSACTARRTAQDNAVRAASATTIGALAERVYSGLPLALVAVEPVPGDTVTWAIDGGGGETGRVIDGSEIPVAFPSGIVRLDDSCTYRGRYMLWLDTPERRPGDRSWSIKYRNPLTPQVVAVDVVTTVTIRGAS